MPISEYLRGLRERVGTSLILIPGVAAVIRDEQGRILLGRRSDDHQWGLPAGAVDPGEEPARTLVREVWEETGLRVVPERILGVFGGGGFRHTYPNGDELESTVVVFECRAIGGRLQARDDETLELRYFHPGELPRLVMPYPRDLLAAGEGRAYFQWDPAWLEELPE